MSFSDFNLNKEFIQSIEAAGYQSPTNLQSQLIPLVNERKSAIIWGQSASGKTGAFLIPAMNYILENPAPEKRGARILILTSRRDRVSQINYTIKRLSSDHTMRFGFIVSGRPYQTQMRLMRRPLDIMIATPGRLNDLMENGKADFSQLEMLIIDDLASICRKNLQGLVENILKQAGKDCSAITFTTRDDEIAPYTETLFPNAEQITLEGEDEEDELELQENTVNNADQKTKQKKETPKQINSEEIMPQKVHIADDYTHKIAMLDHLLDEFAGESTIIYTATNKAAKTLQDNLYNHGHTAELIEGAETNKIKDCDILIYSDQSKIELDSDLTASLDANIINFDLPYSIDNYLTRLQKHDQSREKATLLMLDGYNFNELKTLEKALGKKLDQVTIPGLEPLKPFVNLSKRKPSNKNHKKKNGNNTKKQNASNNRKTNKNEKNSKKGKHNNKAGGRSKHTKNQTQESNQSRQHKGPFGRLNGGTHRKNKDNKVGVSRVGTGTPKSDRGWQSDYAEPKERSADPSKTVTIRYNKKRTLSIKKPEEL